MGSGKEIRNSVIAGVILLATPFLFKGFRLLFLGKVEISFWLLILLSLCSVILFIIILFRIRSPKWVSYTTDMFDGMTWRWTYIGFDYVISPPYPYCPDDDTKLVYTNNSYTYETSFICETCSRRFGPFSENLIFNQGRIVRQIERNIRANTFSR